MRHPRGLIDMTGMKFGHLTVIEYAGSSNDNSSNWKCKCICGKEIIRQRWRLLKSKRNASCGCVDCFSPYWEGPGKAKDYIGKKFGWFTVIGSVSGKDGKEWQCKCRCGAIVNKKTNLLNRDNIHPEFNCGCHRHGYKKGGFEEIAINQVISGIISTAKRRGLEININKQDIIDIINKPCHYCGTIGGNVKRSFKGPWIGKEFRYNGIDRIDSKKGYDTGNIVPCCGECNEGKMDRSPEMYIAHCRKVVEYNS